MAIFTRAVDFMVDNIHDHVVSSKILKDGTISYKLENGFTYHIDEEQIKVLNRYGYTPRFKNKGNN